MKKQITVYRIVRDRAYAKLIPIDRAAYKRARADSWRFDGTRDESVEWAPLELQPSDPDLPPPDIWEIVPGTYALEHRAYYELCSSAEETQQGRVNFTTCEGRRLAVVDSTLVIDCLDHAKSVIETAKKTARIKTYVFDGTQLAISLFKIPETKNSELLTLDGFDSSNDFKTLVDQHAFTGVTFKRLWTGDSFMDA